MRSGRPSRRWCFPSRRHRPWRHAWPAKRYNLSRSSRPCDNVSSLAGLCWSRARGGLLCPLTQEHTFADLIKQLDLPVLIVARRSLGTLNHTLLTVEAALRRDLRVVGIVVNETSPPISVAEQTNVEELAVRVPVPIRAVVSYRNGGYEEEIPPISAIDWWSLGQGRM
jgi:hypothetical protein